MSQNLDDDSGSASTEPPVTAPAEPPVTAIPPTDTTHAVDIASRADATPTNISLSATPANISLSATHADVALSATRTDIAPSTTAPLTTSPANATPRQSLRRSALPSPPPLASPRSVANIATPKSRGAGSKPERSTDLPSKAQAVEDQGGDDQVDLEQGVLEPRRSARRRASKPSTSGLDEELEEVVENMVAVAGMPEVSASGSTSSPPASSQHLDQISTRHQHVLQQISHFGQAQRIDNTSLGLLHEFANVVFQPELPSPEELNSVLRRLVTVCQLFIYHTHEYHLQDMYQVGPRRNVRARSGTQGREEPAKKPRN